MSGWGWGSLPGWGVAHAGEPVVYSEPPGITIEDKVDGGTFQATFYLSSSQTISNVTVTANELRPVEDPSLPRISISQIDLQHTDTITHLLAGAHREIATVKIITVPGAGEWAGDLVVEWTEPRYGNTRIPLTVTAVTVPKLELLDITQVVIRGEQNRSYDRVIRLRETGGGTPVKGLAADVQDLYIDGGGTVIPARQITTSISGASVSGNLPAIGLNVNLNGIPHGKYTGKLWVTSENAADLPVPIEVTVKHQWPLPAFVMIVGLLIAIGIAQYRTLRAGT